MAATRTTRLQLLSTTVVAEELHVSRMTVHRMIQRGELQGYRIGGYIKVDKAEVERILQPIVV